MKNFITVLAILAIIQSAFSQECVGSAFQADPTSCTTYQQCSNGILVRHPCPAGLNFNAAGGYCDWPETAGCKIGQLPEVPQTTTTATATEAPAKTTTTTTTVAPAQPSDGFIYTKEVYCQTNLEDCLRAYPNNAGGLPGKVYYGRGMMQLTWDYNYKSASAYLYGDDRLIQNPDQVGDDPAVGWATAAWYWFANVHTRSSSFGTTLKAINGALECEGGPNGGHRYLRFMHYKQILELLGEPQPADDDGWCTAW